MSIPMLSLAIKSGLPLVYVRTTDLVNVEQVLTFIAEEPVKYLQIPEVINKVSALEIPEGRVHWTSGECKSLVKLYHFCANNDLTLIFVNTEKSVLQFDGGELVPPKELVKQYIADFADDPDLLLPSFGGLTLKDVGEVSKMTMTRDESLTPRGINQTRGGYRNLKGITQVETDLKFYLEPSYLGSWLAQNRKFFKEPIHESLTPRGLLFDGPPGTGKTLAAKHIAANFGIPLYRMDVGAMKGKYVGESESNLLAALSQVDQVEPCVVILDEVEKIFQSQGDSGVTTSLLSQLLWWLQEHKTKVFTVMTTNDITKIPPELYREGRMDGTMQFLGVETLEQGIEFANQAMESMLKEVSPDLDDTNLAAAQKELTVRIKNLYMDGDAVPQAKLTQTAYTLIKEALSDES